MNFFLLLAEGEGFEPPVPLGTTVFKTAAIDHSAIPPKNRRKSSILFCVLQIQCKKLEIKLQICFVYLRF